MLTCIGCGALERPRECTGDCRDVRVDLVPAAAHDRLAAVARLLERLVALGPAPGDVRGAYLGARDEARRELAPAAEPERITAWGCATCGRVEAPRPCVGICTRRPAEMVRADAYDAIASSLAIVRQAAWTTPREGHWASSWQALVAAATFALDAQGAMMPA